MLSLIFIVGSKFFISIEAKYLSDFNYKKDIYTNKERIKIASKEKKYSGIQVLLITEKKWIGAKRQENKDTSNYVLLRDYIQNDTDIPFIVLFWEDIRELVRKKENMKEAYEFLSRMLSN
ncbi:MAG: hypothetical protein FH751_07300 [Firmicutes bacterium]|nr:hypothetical protein [Bacillota bacterium]